MRDVPRVVVPFPAGEADEPNCCGYNRTWSSTAWSGASVHYADLPVEGMVEFWFEDMDAFGGCYSTVGFKLRAACTQRIHRHRDVFRPCLTRAAELDEKFGLHREPGVMVPTGRGRCYEVKASRVFDDAVVSGLIKGFREDLRRSAGQTLAARSRRHGDSRSGGHRDRRRERPGRDGSQTDRQQRCQGVRGPTSKKKFDRSEAIIADGGGSRGVSMDVADEGSWRELVKVVDGAVGLGVLVSNAGMCQNGTVSSRPQSLNRIMDVDCWGVYNGIRCAHPPSSKRAALRIVNTCSYQGAFRTRSFIPAMPWPRPSHGHDARRRHRPRPTACA